MGEPSTAVHAQEIKRQEQIPKIQRWNRGYRRLLQEPKRHEGQMFAVSALQRGAPGTYTREDYQIQLVQPFLGLEKRQCTVQPIIRPGENTTRKRHIMFGDQACEVQRWKERLTIHAWMSISNGMIGLTASSVCTGRRFRSVGARWERAETCREGGWLFFPATRTGRGQTNIGNISRGRSTPFIGFSLPAAPTRFSPSTLAKAAGSRSLSASSSTCGLTTEKASLSGIPTGCRHPSVVCCSPDRWQLQSRPSKRGRYIGSVSTKYRVRQRLLTGHDRRTTPWKAFRHRTA